MAELGDCPLLDYPGTTGEPGDEFGGGLLGGEVADGVPVVGGGEAHAGNPVDAVGVLTLHLDGKVEALAIRAVLVNNAVFHGVLLVGALIWGGGVWVVKGWRRDLDSD